MCAFLSRAPSEYLSGGSYVRPIFSDLTNRDFCSKQSSNSQRITKSPIAARSKAVNQLDIVDTIMQNNSSHEYV